MSIDFHISSWIFQCRSVTCPVVDDIGKKVSRGSDDHDGRADSKVGELIVRMSFKAEGPVAKRL